MKRTGQRPRRNLALAVLCPASFMAVADPTIVSVALPSVRRELGFSGADAQWVLNGYALAFGGLLLVFGRRLLFLAGLGVVATLVAAVAARGYLVGGLRAGFLACAAFTVVALPGKREPDAPKARVDGG